MPAVDLLQWLAVQLVRLGPGVLFVVCLLETAIFAGLILPVGALIAFAAMLASRGLFSPAEVVTVALLGAFIGDQLGFVVGRFFVSRARPPRGDIAEIWGRALAGADALVRRRGLLGVSTARAIPFVRTIMPWFAGRSGVSWPRFVVYDALGVLLWGTIYIGGGFLAGEGWRQVAARYGESAGAVLVLLLLLAFLFLIRRWVARAFASPRQKPK
jgi:membrane-associated protein